MPLPAEPTDLNHVKKLIEQAQVQLRLHTVQQQTMYSQSPAVIAKNFIPNPKGRPKPSTQASPIQRREIINKAAAGESAFHEVCKPIAAKLDEIDQRNEQSQQRA